MAPRRPRYEDLLATAMETLATSTARAGSFHGPFCKALQELTEAQAVALLDGSPETKVLLAVHPSKSRKWLEDAESAPLVDKAIRASSLTVLLAEGRTSHAQALANLGLSNGVVLPLKNGPQRVATCLLFDVNLGGKDEAVLRFLKTLSGLGGLLSIQGQPDTGRQIQNRIQELEEANRVMAKNEERFRVLFDSVNDLFNSMNDAIFVHDIETGAILDVNRRMCEMYGYTREEALSKSMGDLSIGLAPCTQEDAMEWMRRAAEGQPQSFEWLAKDKSGRLFWIEEFLSLAVIDGKNRLLATARDITERKRTETEQSARLKRAEAQNAVFLALAGVGSNFEAALELIAHHLSAQVGDLCLLHLINGEGFLIPSAIAQPYIDGTGLLPKLGALPNLNLESPGPGEVARTGDSIRLTDPRGTRIQPLLTVELHPYLKRYEMHSLLIVPMRSQGQTIGTISLAKGGSSRAYSEEDLAMLQNLADRAALTITNSRLYAENIQQAELLRQSNAELEQRVAERTAELAQANTLLQQLATSDALTGLSNRRRFNEVMDEEIRRARRSGEHFALLMCDVDFFKRYNDRYGHQGGDTCLRAVGETMRELFRRAGELPARYGGEEFAVILPGVSKEIAMKAGEKLRQAILSLGLPHEASDVAPCVTLSIGAVSSKVLPETDVAWFIAKADEALYQSKANGRNRVTLAETS